MMLQSPKSKALLLGALFLLVIIACVSYASYHSSSTAKSAHSDNSTNTPLIVVLSIIALANLLIACANIYLVCTEDGRDSRGVRVHMIHQQSSEFPTTDSEQRNPAAQLNRRTSGTTQNSSEPLLPRTEVSSFEKFLKEKGGLGEHGPQFFATVSRKGEDKSLANLKDVCFVPKDSNLQEHDLRRLLQPMNTLMLLSQYGFGIRVPDFDGRDVGLVYGTTRKENKSQHQKGQRAGHVTQQKCYPPGLALYQGSPKLLRVLQESADLANKAMGAAATKLRAAFGETNVSAMSKEQVTQVLKRWIDAAKTIREQYTAQQKNYSYQVDFLYAEYLTVASENSMLTLGVVLKELSKQIALTKQKILKAITTLDAKQLEQGYVFDADILAEGYEVASEKIRNDYVELRETEIDAALLFARQGREAAENRTKIHESLSRHRLSLGEKREQHNPFKRLQKVKGSQAQTIEKLDNALEKVLSFQKEVSIEEGRAFTEGEANSISAMEQELKNQSAKAKQHEKILNAIYDAKTAELEELSFIQAAIKYLDCQQSYAQKLIEELTRPPKKSKSTNSNRTSGSTSNARGSASSRTSVADNTSHNTSAASGSSSSGLRSNAGVLNPQSQQTSRLQNQLANLKQQEKTNNDSIMRIEEMLRKSQADVESCARLVNEAKSQLDKAIEKEGAARDKALSSNRRGKVHLPQTEERKRQGTKHAQLLTNLKTAKDKLEAQKDRHAECTKRQQSLKSKIIALQAQLS